MRKRGVKQTHTSQPAHTSSRHHPFAKSSAHALPIPERAVQHNTHTHASYQTNHQRFLDGWMDGPNSTHLMCETIYIGPKHNDRRGEPEQQATSKRDRQTGWRHTQDTRWIGYNQSNTKHSVYYHTHTTNHTHRDVDATRKRHTEHTSRPGRGPQNRYTSTNHAARPPPPID
mmetsp:Transcript_36744/g.105347  ORF Transcript_36744/g.105347 Transcript_36744/m.105347 type:complete len:172 (+) Transcript_36744:578-1093(+)